MGGRERSGWSRTIRNGRGRSGTIEIDQGAGTILNLGTFDILVEPGPEFSVVYARRADYQAAGLKYTLEFSADGVDWEAGGGPPVVVATGVGADGAPAEAVKSAYPYFLSNGRKARFVHLVMSIVYP